jgi:predicted outer membrane repeat protein
MHEPSPRCSLVKGEEIGAKGRVTFFSNLNPLALCAIALLTVALSAHATTLTVTNTDDNGTGSLRDTLAAATDGDTITFAVTGSIVLTSGELLVEKSITISGPGSDNLAVDGNASSRVFHIAPDQTVSITGLTITNGMTDEDGGGIYNDHGSLALSACAITGNSAGNGGGIYSDGFGGTADLMIDSSTINGNLATARLAAGGGIYNDQAMVTLNDCTIAGNFAIYGGAIHNDGENGAATLEITNCTIKNNTATIIGGGIDNDSVEGSTSVTIQAGTLSGNSARIGGGIYNDGFDKQSHARLTISNSILNGNSADVGGCIYNDSYIGDASLTINDSDLSDNSAANRGGCIYNEMAQGIGILTLNNTSFSGNSAGDSGGAIYNDQGVFFTINYCAISGNSAQKRGGGVYNDGSFQTTASLTINSSTLDENSASAGGAIFNDAEQGGTWLNINNSTISGNTASSDGSLASRGYGGGLASNGDNARIVSVDISNTTFSDNAASHAGGSIYNVGQNDPNIVLVTLANTILKSGPLGGNIFSNSATIESQGYNLSNDSGGGFLTGPGDQTNVDPMLGPLQDNGGPTFTHALLPGSPAIDAGDPNFAPPPMYDQRGTGFDRVVNGRLDIGSFELQTSKPVPSPRLGPPSRSRPIAMRRPTPP